MITTITMNASVDKLYLVKDNQPDTVMRVEAVHNTAGGKGLNVAKVAALTGERVRAMGFLGGYNGQYVRSMLRSRGIEDDFTEIPVETRSCINIRNLATGKHTEYLEPGASVTEEDLSRFLEQFRAALETSDVLTISGSVPAGAPEDFYGSLIQSARDRGCPVILDTSGALLKNGISSRPTLIKPNLDELEQLTGQRASAPEQAAEIALRLHREGIPYVAVSLGGEGALLACGEGVFHASAPKVQTVNTVGCGDSMVAGFAIGLRRGYEAAALLSYGVAVATANALTMPTGHIEPHEVEPLLHRITVCKLY